MKEDNGLTLAPRRSSRFPAVKVTDLDFADDLALISDAIEKAQRLLHDLETAASDIGLHVNDIKTEYMLINIDDPEAAMTTLDGKSLENKYSILNT